MTLSELLALLTLLVAAAALMVEVAKAGFDIAWKVAHDRSNDDNKKSKYPPQLPTRTVACFLCA